MKKKNKRGYKLAFRIAKTKRGKGLIQAPATKVK
jgi:hypothetical protein